MANNHKGPSVYLTTSVDGDETAFLCDGRWHVQRYYETLGDPSTMMIEGKCDGSCASGRREVDLRELVASAKNSAFSYWSDAACMDQMVTELLATDRPLSGVKFENIYAKRNSQTTAFCLGDYHVCHTERLDWPVAYGEPAHTFSASLCDGSCHRPTKLTSREKRLLHKQARTQM